jgi:hypothetical protein
VRLGSVCRRFAQHYTLTEIREFLRIFGRRRICDPTTLEAAMRNYLAALIFVGSLSSASAATYTIQNWPQDLNKVPCDAWKHNSDGTWVEIGTIVVGGNATSGMTFKDTDEAKMLDAKCPH